jgi:hypothetical protein
VDDDNDPSTPDVAIPDEDTTTGFQARRTKIWAKGNVAENWGFKVQGNFNRDGGDFELEDAYITNDINDSWSWQFGQFRLPLLREDSVSSANQLAVERSLTNEVFRQNRSQGVQFNYTGDAFRFMGAFSDGLRTQNTDFNSMAEADYALTGRFEWKWAGDWAQFEDFTSWQGDDNAGMLGAAIHYQGGGETGGPTADIDVLRATADISFEGNGWNAFGAFIYDDTEPDGFDSTTNYGWLVQGGVFLNEQWELFGRYDMTMPDDDLDLDDFSTITAGVNYYITPQSHAVKFTGDVQYFLDEVDGGLTVITTGAGNLPDDSDGQFVIRLQFQLVF